MNVCSGQTARATRGENGWGDGQTEVPTPATAPLSLDDGDRFVLRTGWFFWRRPQACTSTRALASRTQ
jgi:hypothetical protein